MAGYRDLTRTKVAAKASTRLKRDSKDALPFWFPIMALALFLFTVFSLIISAGNSQEDNLGDAAGPAQEVLPPVFGRSTDASDTTVEPVETSTPEEAPTTTEVSTEPPVETSVPEVSAPQASMVALPRLNGGTLDVPADAVVAALSWAEANGLSTTAQPAVVLSGPTTVILSLAVDTGEGSEGFNVAISLKDGAWTVQ